MSNDVNQVRHYRVRNMRKLPMFTQLAALAVPCVLMISYVMNPGIWIVYALTAFTLGLVTTTFQYYNNMAVMFNYLEYNELQQRIAHDHALILKMNGTSKEEECLIKETPSNGKDEDAK